MHLAHQSSNLTLACISFVYRLVKNAEHNQHVRHCMWTIRSGNCRSNNSDLLSAIQAHLNMKASTCLLFRCRNWFAERIGGFSRFFRDESNSEHQHAAKFAEPSLLEGRALRCKLSMLPCRAGHLLQL